MTLTVVVGSSGSGKTTFLEHVHKLHSCTYIRQYHTLRPYVPVKKIPRFDPTQLPYWKLYSDKELKESGGKKNESYNPAVKIGGTMAGEFTAGLSGGQRKMMLFELVRQRVSGQSDLLIVLDEPFAGVTDDFVPYIMERLDEMRIKHNILLVTNDHVAALTKMADSTITVSAIDRSKVLLNNPNPSPSPNHNHNPNPNLDPNPNQGVAQRRRAGSRDDAARRRQGRRVPALARQPGPELLYAD